MPAADMTLISYDTLQATPWKNGGGVTRELACWPDGASFDNFVWRISIADVHQSGPFSRFPGIDRVITLLEGDGMHLHFAQGDTHALTQTLMPYRFCGEESLDAQLVGTPSRDFNLMLRRDAACGEVEVRRTGGSFRHPHPDEQGRVTLLLFCVTGHWQAIDGSHAGHILHPGDTLLLENVSGQIDVTDLCAESVLVCVHITVLP